MPRQPLIEIDVSVPTTTEHLHLLLAAKLGFPNWYGQNWDAFDEAIAELVEMPVTLRLVGFNELARKLPRDAQLLRQCLDLAHSKHPSSASAIVLA